MKVIDKEYTVRADSRSNCPNVITVKMTKGAQIIEMECTGCHLTFTVREPYSEDGIEKEEREFHLYKFGQAYEPPCPSEFYRLGKAGAADSKCMVYERSPVPST